MARTIVVIVWYAPGDERLGEQYARILAANMYGDGIVYATGTTYTQMAKRINPEDICHMIPLLTNNFLVWSYMEASEAREWGQAVEALRERNAFGASVVVRKIRTDKIAPLLAGWWGLDAMYVNVERVCAELPATLAQISQRVMEERKRTAILEEQKRTPIYKVSGRITAFISYAHPDRAFEQQLLGDLQAAGVTVWVDHERLKSGTPDWELAIRRGITASNALIYVGTEDAMMSVFVRSELTIAHDNAIPIHAIWARGSTWSSCAPFQLMPTQYEDARGSKYASAVQSIIASLKKANGGS